ncbi:MAG: RidA family protein [Rhodocyclaceae bacterium]|nr:RidA family protein [Rhodocyclaceae bacterium]
MSIRRHGTTNRHSDVVTHNGVLYTVEVPSTEHADIVIQTREVLAGLDKLLAQGGSDRSRILMATIYLTHIADYARMNGEWDRWLPTGSAPSRCCVEVARLAKDGWRVEIALTAACD